MTKAAFDKIRVGLEEALAFVHTMTDEELAAATRAVQRQEARKGEDIDEWARTLGDGYGRMTD